MHLRKKGAALISTMIILALMLTLGSLMFKNMRNNNELSSVYEFEKDTYDLNTDEEDFLYKSMKKLNEKYKTNQLNNEDVSIESLLSDDLQDNYYTLSYDKNNKKIILTNNKVRRTREILCNFNEEKLILIPTCKFQSNSE